jgi:DNA-binding PadR family transcriptional regulator
MLRYVLLALLSDGAPRHGYALMKGYARRSGTHLSIGNVYRELQHLVAGGLIVAATNPAGADPRRMPYAITKRGLDALSTWLAAPAYSLVRTTPDVLSYRLALLGDLDPVIAGRFLKELQDELWVQTKALERERTAVIQQDRVAEGTLSMRSILLGRRTRHLAADIAMVEEMRTALEAVQERAGSHVPRLAIESPTTRGGRPRQERRAYKDEA